MVILPLSVRRTCIHLLLEFSIFPTTGLILSSDKISYWFCNLARSYFIAILYAILNTLLLILILQVFLLYFNTAHVKRAAAFGTSKTCAIYERFIYLLYPLSP